jgi:flagellar assembly protein FliH
MTGFDFDFAPLQAPAPPISLDAAEDLVAHARADAHRVRDQARAEGFELGRREAVEASANAVAALSEIARATEARADALAARLEAEAVELAFAVATQILGAHVEADAGLVVGAVRGALRSLVEREAVTVLVHPDDLDLVRAAGDDLRATLGGIERWEVQAERRVARGGAVVRYRDGELDASHVAKLERAREVVAESLAPPVGA